MLPAKIPTLRELESKSCSLEELQAALVQLIKLHNEQGTGLQLQIDRKQDRPFRTSL